VTVEECQGKRAAGTEHHRASGLAIGGQDGCVLVPAYQAGRTVETVIQGLADELAVEPNAILVVDDGSTDETGARARHAGARVFRQEANSGKGAALLRGLIEARKLGYQVALTVDADGQHPAVSARQVLHASDNPHALVLGVRNLKTERAPRANRFSNGVSNLFLSLFAGLPLHDTQCGLRRYPIEETLALASRARGYAFEAEVLLRAAHAKLVIVQREVKVHYPPERERVTHFDSVRDPVRIIATVLRTVHELRRHGKKP
jgi:glycosyltransferase involved in cell wall biosynthesis